MRTRRLPAIILLLAALHGGFAAAAATLHVSPSGDDGAAGTADEPLATLAAARDAIRDMKPLPKGGVTVLISPGTYAVDAPLLLTKRDAGTKDRPVVYRATRPGTARLIGGRLIPATAFKKNGATFRVDLRSLGIRNLGTIDRRALSGGAILELFFGGRPMTLARWPNTGWVTMGRVTDNGLDKDGSCGRFIYRDDRHARWAGRDDVFLHGFWTHDWSDDTLRVAKIDTKKKEITLADRHGYGLDTRGHGTRRYYALNIPGEVDAPGEYHLDRKTGILTFIPPADPSSGEIAVSLIEKPIIALRDASFITVAGLVLEYGRVAAVSVAGGRGVRIRDCTVRNVGGDGIRLSGGTDNGVVRCEVTRTGKGGIRIAGGDRKTLTPARLFAEDNHVHHFARRRKTYQPGISLHGVGNRMSRNHIHDAPHAAVLYGGNEHVLELNHVHHVAMETGDVGAFYTGRDWTSRGNIVRHNYIHDIAGGRSYGSMAVYLDDCDSGDAIVGNVFRRCDKAAFIGGGRDNVVRNNVFVDCAVAVHLDDRGRRRMKFNRPGDSWDLEAKAKRLNYTAPPWSTRYPSLARVMEDRPRLPLHNVVENNVIVRCKKPMNLRKLEKLVTMKDNLITDEDPGFVDMAGGDFRLKKDAAVFAKIPGFKTIPVEKIGPAPKGERQ